MFLSAPHQQLRVLIVLSDLSSLYVPCWTHCPGPGCPWGVRPSSPRTRPQLLLRAQFGADPDVIAASSPAGACPGAKPRQGLDPGLWTLCGQRGPPGALWAYGFFSAKHTFLRKGPVLFGGDRHVGQALGGGPATEYPVCHWPARSPPRQTHPEAGSRDAQPKDPSGVAGRRAERLAGRSPHTLRRAPPFKKQSPPPGLAVRLPPPGRVGARAAPAVLGGGRAGARPRLSLW